MKTLQKFDKVCNELKDEFVEKYFSDKDYKVEDMEIWWVADKIGRMLCIGDYFFNFDDIVEALRLEPTQAQLFGWYYWNMEEHKPAYNLKSWIKLYDQDKEIIKFVKKNK